MRIPAAQFSSLPILLCSLNIPAQSPKSGALLRPYTIHDGHRQETLYMMGADRRKDMTFLNISSLRRWTKSYECWANYISPDKAADVSYDSAVISGELTYLSKYCK